jgi:hypothetical protein
VPKVTTRSLYPECIANLKLPIDTFYRESRSGVNIAKRNITSGLFGLNKPLLKVYSITPYTVISIENLLFGSDNLTDENNLIVFRNAQKYIHHSNRFE